jgi:hypothetical protein
MPWSLTSPHSWPTHLWNIPFVCPSIYVISPHISPPIYKIILVCQPTCLYNIPPHQPTHLCNIPLVSPSIYVISPHISPPINIINISLYSWPIHLQNNICLTSLFSQAVHNIHAYPTLHITQLGPLISIGHYIPPGPPINIKDIHNIGLWSAGLSYAGYYVDWVTHIIQSLSLKGLTFHLHLTGKKNYAIHSFKSNC